MVLLDAFLAHRPDVVAAVATFDHGSGPAAAEAVELVVAVCLQRGVTVVTGRMAGDGGQLAVGGGQLAVDGGQLAVGGGRTADGVLRKAYSFSSVRPTEASWRAERWRFLRAVAEDRKSVV